MEAGDAAATLARARQGDGEAFRLLVDAHARMAFALAFRLTGDERDAEDVVQESFIRAYRRLGRFESRSNFGTWLHRIVVNCAMDTSGACTRRLCTPPTMYIERGVNASIVTFIPTVPIT